MFSLPNPLIIPVGIAVGIAISAPVGPVNVLCIQRSLQRGIAGGVAAGLGAVLGDGLIALAAAMGIGAIDTMVTYYRTAIQAVGGVALIVFGLILYAAKAAVPSAQSEAEDGRVSDYLSDVPKAFLMTVTNPAAVLGLFAIFGGIGTFVEVRGAVDAAVLVAAIMGGSLTWWIVLSAIVAKISVHYGEINMGRVNLIAGGALILFGLVLLSEVGWQIWRLLGGGRFVAGLSGLFG